MNSIGGCFGYFCSFLHVRLNVKVGEEDKEHGTMGKNDITEDLGESAIIDDWNHCLQENKDKLDQLHGSQVPTKKIIH